MTQIPITGYFSSSDTYTVEGFYVWSSPGQFVLPEKIKTLAIRCIDVLMAEGGRAEAMDWMAARWLRMKGFIRPVELVRNDYFYAQVIDEVTDAGREFHRKHAAPIGEW